MWIRYYLLYTRIVYIDICANSFFEVSLMSSLKTYFIRLNHFICREQTVLHACCCRFTAYLFLNLCNVNKFSSCMNMGIDVVAKLVFFAQIAFGS